MHPTAYQAALSADLSPEPEGQPGLMRKSPASLNSINGETGVAGWIAPPSCVGYKLRLLPSNTAMRLNDKSSDRAKLRQFPRSPLFP